jgi:hypothetical protein
MNGENISTRDNSTTGGLGQYQRVNGSLTMLKRFDRREPNRRKDVDGTVPAALG